MAEARALTVGIDASRATIAQKTGTERYSARILEAVLALGTRHRFRLYLNARQPLPLALRAGDRQRLIPFPRLWTHARLSAELAGHPPDALFVPAHVVPLVHPRASGVTIHDLGYLYEPEAHPVARRLALDLTTRWSARAAARVIAISGATRDDLVRRYGVPAEKITVIHHGVDGAFQPPAEAEVARVRERYQLPARYLLSVGTLQPRKNLARLIAAFERLAAEDEELGLILAGKTGWLAGTIEAALTASPARARITLTGHVPDADLPALYGGAAAFAFPSLYEGFGMPA
ncbi:MAG TPA: glycosyltransferase family 1 protein, partial [Nitrolancea sp.]|nr:glycosyltransferase family 1 protein [Nitrolancea sp.]